VRDHHRAYTNTMRQGSNANVERYIVCYDDGRSRRRQVFLYLVGCGLARPLEAAHPLDRGADAATTSRTP
jgi:hypothetical protein